MSLEYRLLPGRHSSFTFVTRSPVEYRVGPSVMRNKCWRVKGEVWGQGGQGTLWITEWITRSFQCYLLSTWRLWFWQHHTIHRGLATTYEIFCKEYIVSETFFFQHSNIIKKVFRVTLACDEVPTPSIISLVNLSTLYLSFSTVKWK